MVWAPSALPSFIVCSRADNVLARLPGSSTVRTAKYGACTETARPRSAASSPKRAHCFSFHGNPLTKGSSTASCPRRTRESSQAASSPSVGGIAEIPNRIMAQEYLTRPYGSTTFGEAYAVTVMRNGASPGKSGPSRVKSTSFSRTTVMIVPSVETSISGRISSDQPS